MSEILLLRQQIELELVAMRRGISGLTEGTARHQFIHARMDQVSSWQEALADYVGLHEACQVVCELYERTMESEETDSLLDMSCSQK